MASAVRRLAGAFRRFDHARQRRGAHTRVIWRLTTGVCGDKKQYNNADSHGFVPQDVMQKDVRYAPVRDGRELNDVTPRR